jgi:hypothetical protein
MAKKRAKEYSKFEAEDFLKGEKQTSCVVQWEQRTCLKIENRDILDRASRVTEKNEENLQQRRGKLKNLYNKERLEWKAAIKLASNVSQEERMLEIKKRAGRLLEKRAKEKQQFVNECYNRRWRDACDEIRSLDARAVTDKLMYDRKEAFSYKADTTLKEEDEKKKVEIKERMKNLKEKEEQEQDEMLKKNLETRYALDVQVKSLQMSRKSQQERRRQEENDQLERWKTEDAEMRRKDMQHIRDAHSRGEEVLRANMKRLEDRERKETEKKKQDSIMLRYALDKEKQEILKEQERKEQGHQAAQEYLVFIQDQMIKEQGDTAHIDKIRSCEMEKISKKRDEAIRKQTDARRNLLADVNKARLEQIKRKEIRQAEEKRDLTQQVITDKKEWEYQEMVERSLADLKKEETVANMMANKDTIEMQKKKLDLEKQKKFFLHKQIQYDEKQHSDKIQNQAGNMKIYFPRRGSDLVLH